MSLVDEQEAAEAASDAEQRRAVALDHWRSTADGLARELEGQEMRLRIAQDRLRAAEAVVATVPVGSWERLTVENAAAEAAGEVRALDTRCGEVRAAIAAHGKVKP
jgi:hypothetical protein